jgi:hypothetical protein
VNLVGCFGVKPDEIYHLGAQSHVRVSFDIRIHLGRHRCGHDPILERSATGIRRSLPGIEQRNVRQSAGGAADRDDAVLAAQSMAWPSCSRIGRR